MNTTPIEFMAWDKAHEKMLAGKELNIDPFLFTETLDFYQDPYYVLMQRTALRSINDEPIYNHMIVKDEWEDHHIINMFDYPLMSFLQGQKLEIVGNRFQSPHLLELCK